VIEYTDYVNVPAHRRRWLELCVHDNGDVDWRGFVLLSTAIPLRDFLDIEEVAVVARDRHFAWSEYLRKHPSVLTGLPEG